MLSVKQAAASLGVSRSKVYQLVACREVVHYRLGGKILFAEADLEAYRARCRVEVAGQATPARPFRLKHVTLPGGAAPEGNPGSARGAGSA